MQRSLSLSPENHRDGHTSQVQSSRSCVGLIFGGNRIPEAFLDCCQDLRVRSRFTSVQVTPQKAIFLWKSVPERPHRYHLD